MHQVVYSDTTRRELIWENLTKKILDKYSQNPATVHLRKTADETLMGSSQRIGGTLVSPNVSTWRRGDDTQSATLDHVILVNFQDTVISVTAETLGIFSMTI
jgi:hypothetical protein